MGRQRDVHGKLRRLIRLKHFGLCDCCKIPLENKRGDIHHKLPVMFGGKDSVDNLVLLCRDCHSHAPNSVDEYINYKALGGWNRKSLIGILVQSHTKVSGIPLDEYLIKAFEIFEHITAWYVEIFIKENEDIDFTKLPEMIRDRLELEKQLDLEK